MWWVRLHQSGLDLLPLGGGDDTGKEIVGEDLLGSFLAAVDSKCDALIEKAKVRGLLSALQLIGRQRGEVAEEQFVVAVELTFRDKHLVVGMVQQIVLK